VSDEHQDMISNGSMLSEDEMITAECEDELVDLDEDMLRILIEPTKAEKLYQQMVRMGDVEQVDWNRPNSVLKYCQVMYRLRLEIYGGDCPLQPPPYQKALNKRVD
jgi:hypothetical protein